jgi:hypothetical protein
MCDFVIIEFVNISNTFDVCLFILSVCTVQFLISNNCLQRSGKVIGFYQLLSVVQDVCCLPFNPLKIRSILQEGEKIVLVWFDIVDNFGQYMV